MNKNPETQKDLRTIREALALSGYRDALAAFGRVESDLDYLSEGLDLYGTHLTGHGCMTKKHPDACNCGLDRRRARAGLSRTTSQDGPQPWARK